MLYRQLGENDTTPRDNIGYITVDANGNETYYSGYEVINTRGVPLVIEWVPTNNKCGKIHFVSKAEIAVCISFDNDGLCMKPLYHYEEREVPDWMDAAYVYRYLRTLDTIMLYESMERPGKFKIMDLPAEQLRRVLAMCDYHFNHGYAQDKLREFIKFTKSTALRNPTKIGMRVKFENWLTSGDDNNLELWTPTEMKYFEPFKPF